MQAKTTIYYEELSKIRAILNSNPKTYVENPSFKRFTETLSCFTKNN